MEVYRTFDFPIFVCPEKGRGLLIRWPLPYSQDFILIFHPEKNNAPP